MQVVVLVDVVCEDGSVDYGVPVEGQSFREALENANDAFGDDAVRAFPITLDDEEELAHQVADECAAFEMLEAEMYEGDLVI